MKKNAVVIGYGGMGGWHTEHLLKSDVCNLIGVYDIKEERNELARSRGIFAYDTYKAVLDDPRVDILTVAIPNDKHRDVVIEGLNGGKNVICEKPVTLNSADLADMIKAAELNKKTFSVHQNRRWDVDYLAMKQLSESGEIGEIFNIESRIHGSRGIPSDWRGEFAHGGGMLFDWGVHLIDQMLMILTDKITSVYCRFDHITNSEVDDGFRLDLQFESGAKAYIEVGTYNFISMPRFYIQGKKGTGIIHDWRQNCNVSICTHWHESEVVPVQTAAGLTKTMAPRDSVTTNEYELDRPLSDVHDYYRNFCAAIDGSADLLVTHSQVMRVLHVIEASFESQARGQVIKTEL